MSARLGWLFLRSRMAGWGVAGLAVVSALFALWGVSRVGGESIVVTATIAAPLIMATLIVGTTRAPFGETEWTASQTLAPLRFGQLAGMLSVAFVGLAVSSLCWQWQDEDLRLLLARNLLGLVGLGLLAALPLGASIAWILPMAVAFFALFNAPNGIGARGYDVLWTWPVRANEDYASVGVSVVLAAVGLLAYTRRSLRETVEDMH